MSYTALNVRSDQQAHFINALINGSEPAAAATIAGYAAPAASASQLLRSQRVLDAIGVALQRRMVAEAAPLAIGFLIAVVKEDRFPAGARVDAAKTLLDRAGIVAKKDAPGAAEKDLGELSSEELHKRIEALEAELGDRAKASLPANPPAIDAQLSELIS